MKHNKHCCTSLLHWRLFLPFAFVLPPSCPSGWSCPQETQLGLWTWQTWCPQNPATIRETHLYKIRLDAIISCQINSPVIDYTSIVDIYISFKIMILKGMSHYKWCVFPQIKTFNQSCVYCIFVNKASQPHFIVLNIFNNFQSWKQ